MKVKAILKEKLPKIDYQWADFEKLEYKGGGDIFVVIPIEDPENKEEIIKITVAFHSLALRVADEGIYFEHDGDYLEREEDGITMGTNLILECFDSDFLKWFNDTSLGIKGNDARHFRIATMNEFVDVIANTEPSVIVEHMKRSEYIKLAKTGIESQLEIDENMELVSKERLLHLKDNQISPEDLEEFKKWKKQQDEFRQ
ncbi:hypothetical protein [Lactovum odontotermitis]